MNLYETLSCGKDATQEQIKAGYRKASLSAHPDTGGTNEEQQQVSQAYEILSDPLKRRIYDESGDTDRAENIRESVQNTFLALFFECSKSHEDDPIDCISRKLDHNERQIRNDISTKRKFINSQEKLLKRLNFKKKGDRTTNYLENALKLRIAEAEEEIKNAENFSILGAMVREECELFEISPSPPPPPKEWTEGNVFLSPQGFNAHFGVSTTPE